MKTLLNTSLVAVGILIGWSLSTMAYKPVLMAQAREIYQLDKDKAEATRRLKMLEIEIEAHRQDMNLFISKSTLMSVLEQLGVMDQMVVDKNESKP